MRERDALALLRDTTELLTGAAALLGPARVRLRTWQANGFPPGRGADAGGGSSGDSHADPVARAVQSLEIKDPGPEGKHRGWRAPDPFGNQLRALDRKLFHLRDVAVDLAHELESLVTDPETPGEDGCTLCNTIRLGPGHDCECSSKHSDCRTKCDTACKCLCLHRDHRHPSSHQQIHNRRAPRPAFDDAPVDDLARCQFHYDFAARYGVDAHPTITLWHLDHPGSHIPTAMIREHHADQYARLHDHRRQEARA